jgi:dTDP-4-dehydrorhamnose 3,5-epimerase
MGPCKWVGSVLDDVQHHQLWAPPGFAHGFLVLSEVADFCYLCSDYFHPPPLGAGDRLE